MERKKKKREKKKNDNHESLDMPSEERETDYVSKIALY